MSTTDQTTSLTGLDGRTMKIRRRAAPCTDLVDADEQRPAIIGDYARCGRAAIELAVDAGGARGVERECLCDEHGGVATAIARLARSWAVLAPLSVDDYLAAGTADLGSEHAIVVVRRASDDSTAPWIAALGVGGHTIGVRGAHATVEAAEVAGLAAWRARLARDVEEIRALRGGTLEWGMPIVPPATPTVLRCERGQSAYAALRVQRILSDLPGARVAGLVPVCERWVNGIGTIPIPAAEATEWATEIDVRGRRVFVLGTDIVYLDAIGAAGRNISALGQAELARAIGHEVCA